MQRNSSKISNSALLLLMGVMHLPGTPTVSGSEKPIHASSDLLEKINVEVYDPDWLSLGRAELGSDQRNYSQSEDTSLPTISGSAEKTEAALTSSGKIAQIFLLSPEHLTSKFVSFATQNQLKWNKLAQTWYQPIWKETCADFWIVKLVPYGLKPFCTNQAFLKDNKTTVMARCEINGDVRRYAADFLSCLCSFQDKIPRPTIIQGTDEFVVARVRRQNMYFILKRIPGSPDVEISTLLRMNL